MNPTDNNGRPIEVGSRVLLASRTRNELTPEQIERYAGSVTDLWSEDEVWVRWGPEDHYPENAYDLEVVG